MTIISSRDGKEVKRPGKRLYVRTVKHVSWKRGCHWPLQMEKGDKGTRWSGWVWVGECFFWYRPTRVVPDQRPLNGRRCCCCSSRDGNFFGNHVTNSWNSLSGHIATSPTVSCFKHRIAKLKFMLQCCFYFYGKLLVQFHIAFVCCRHIHSVHCVSFCLLVANKFDFIWFDWNVIDAARL